MVLINPFCTISAAKIAGLKTTVVLLLMLLMKSKLLRIKMSIVGSLLGFAMLVGFVLTTGALTVLTGGAVIRRHAKPEQLSDAQPTSCLQWSGIGCSRGFRSCRRGAALEFSGPHPGSWRCSALVLLGISLFCFDLNPSSQPLKFLNSQPLKVKHLRLQSSG